MGLIDRSPAKPLPRGWRTTIGRRLEVGMRGDGRGKPGLGATSCLSRSSRLAVLALELGREPVEPLIDALDVIACGDPQPAQRSLDGFIHHAFEVAAPPFDLAHDFTRHV